MIKFKYLSLLALTACTLIVLGTGIARAIVVSEIASTPSVLAQSTPVQQATQPEVEAVNQATLEYLRRGRENLQLSPSLKKTVIKEGYALVTWTWGEAGGQTILAFTNERWTVLTGGGGAVDVAVLEAAGVPTNIAEQLIERDRASWYP